MRENAKRTGGSPFPLFVTDAVGWQRVSCWYNMWYATFSRSVLGGVSKPFPCVFSVEFAMSIDLSDLHNLPVAEKLRIVEALWDDFGA